MIKLQTQQGDCIMEVVNSMPKGAKKIKLGTSLVVLRGEGVNTHEITDTSCIEAYKDGETLYLKTSKPVEIVHQEHGKTRLEPNKIYKRIIEREFNYEDMEARETRD